MKPEGRYGPMIRFQKNRKQILERVVQRTIREIDPAGLANLLEETLYQEKHRLKHEHKGFFTRRRLREDNRLWKKTAQDLLKRGVPHSQILQKIATHYAEEIGGHFSPFVFKLATRLIPFGFNWLLNVASIKHVLPWGLKESIESQVNIVGEVGLIRKLHEKGTLIMLPTHQSNLDSIVMGYVIELMNLPPFAYGAGLNLFSNPILSFFMGNLGAYTVDRRKKNPIYMRVLKNYSTEILREGVHSIFFPGGGRSRSGALESRLKLGLLSTGLQAQIENIRENKPHSAIYYVPVVISYNVVLEAPTLIDDHLAAAGKHRYIIMDDEFWQIKKVLSFFWKFFSNRSQFTVRIGRPLDVFGNPVDDEGRSLGSGGLLVDPRTWLTSQGELVSEKQRDREYTLELSGRLAERFHCENTVMASHLVAFSYFEALRMKYTGLDLYQFLRLPEAQRRIPYAQFLQHLEVYYQKIEQMAALGKLFLGPEFQTKDVAAWVRVGIANLGVFHPAAVVRTDQNEIWSDDLNLLYYYRNRLSGYGLSLLSGVGQPKKSGENDQLGFLA